MNREERTPDPEIAMIAILRGWQAGLYTAMPAIIDSFDATKQTCEAVITVKALVTNRDGSTQWITLPKLVDVPVHFPCGGGYTLTFPIVQGDEALIVFASRCIDNWWLAGGIQEAPDLRMHDLSDGFAFVGFRSQARLISNISTTAAQLRSDDGANYVEVGAGIIKATAATEVTIDAPTTRVKHALIVEGTATIAQTLTYQNGMVGTGTATSNGKDVASTHKHSGVTTGGGQTGVPV